MTNNFQYKILRDFLQIFNLNFRNRTKNKFNSKITDKKRNVFQSSHSKQTLNAKSNYLVMLIELLKTSLSSEISLPFPIESALRPMIGNAVSIEFPGMCQCFQLDIDALLYLRLLNMAFIDPLIIVVHVASINPFP